LGVVGWAPLRLSVRFAEMRLAASIWGTHRVTHGRSRSGIMLVPLASGGRHECFGWLPVLSAIGGNRDGDAPVHFV
jgi:hypothetical protein